MCFGAEFPDYYFSVPPEERPDRIEITESLCVVDGTHFFIRGRVEIPVIDTEETFCWNVWASVSETNFRRTNEMWNDPERVNEPAYFGWLQTSLPCYPETLSIKIMLHTQELGIIPQVELIEEGHALTQEQQQGITWQRVTQLVETAMHG